MLEILKGTPVPIVLVIGGLIFLLIPFIQKIQSKEIEFETKNQIGAGIIGFILLVIGIGLYIIPSGTAASTLAFPNSQSVPTHTGNVPPLSDTPYPSGFTQDQINNALGINNWKCFPEGRLDGVSFLNVPNNFVVKYPISNVDRQGIKYKTGETVPVGGLATAWIEGQLASQNECPSGTAASTPALPSSQSASGNISPLSDTPYPSGITQGQINDALGIGNWKCFPEGRLDGISFLNVPNNFVVKYPISSVDRQGVKYKTGETVPVGGLATAWIEGQLTSQNECP